MKKLLMVAAVLLLGAGAPAVAEETAGFEVAMANPTSLPVYYTRDAGHTTMFVTECPAVVGCAVPSCASEKTDAQTALVEPITWSPRALLAHADRIGLGESQKKALSEIVAQSKDLDRHREQLQSEEEQLSELLRSQGASLEKIEQQVREVERLRADLRVASIRQDRELRRVVRSEQAQALTPIATGIATSKTPNSITF